MAHNHFHLKEEHSKSRQFRVSLALIGTMAGGVLLACSGVARLIYGNESFHMQFSAMLGAILLGGPVIWHALKCLLSGHRHMDELVGLAIIALFSTQQYTVAGVVGFFMLLSQLMETRTALGARASIESLIRLTPTKANIVEAGGMEKEVKVSKLKVGDVVRVRPGDNIPADGEVIEGLSTVNEATITGESLPVDKVPGLPVYAGTNNLTGVLDLKVSKAGKDTTLGKVQQLILDAEQTKIPIMRIIDRYVKWYTPTILMIAAIFWFFTRNVDAAITILIISCPCALILATPTAMVAAISAAARLGVLVKNVSDLELAGKITAMVFDKTGTLTTGRLYVTKLTPTSGIEHSELLSLAASAEQMSKHPAARAIHVVAKEAKLPLPTVENFRETPGKGVQAKVNGRDIAVGRESFLHELNVDMSGVDGPKLDAEQGFSTLYVSRDNKCIGWVGMQDKTRPEAKQAKRELLDKGMKRITMLTGDRQEVAKRVAGELGCTDFRAQCFPQEKLAIVERIRKDGHTVVVVGDGINDAPALAAGDMGIAMGAAGSDVAINSASVVLMNNDLKRLPFLIALARKTSNVIWMNLGIGMLFIITAIAFSNFIPPYIAAVLHFLSSLIVIFNSARLVREGEHLESGADLQSVY